MIGNEVKTVADAREVLAAWWQYTKDVAPAPIDADDLRQALRGFHERMGADLVAAGLTAVDLLEQTGNYGQFVHEHSVRLRIEKDLGLDGERPASGAGWLAADALVGAVPAGGVARFHLAARGQPSWCPLAVKSNGVPSATVEAILGCFDAANRVARGLRPPEKLRVEIDLVSNRLVYDGFWGELSTARRYRFEGAAEIEQTPEATLVMTAHEYGHAIFCENLPMVSRYSALTGQTLGGVRRLRLSVHEHQVALYRKLDDPSLTDADRQKLTAELEVANERRRILDSELDRMARQVKPYNELFADVVAVLVAGDGAAIANALYAPANFPSDAEREAWMQHDHRFRDFTSEIPVNGWCFDSTRHDASHYLLSPTRSYLWQHCLKDCVTSGEPGSVLADLLTAVTTVLERRQNGWRELNAPSVEEINRELIDAFTELRSSSPVSPPTIRHRRSVGILG